jgi:hypothetical protein
MYTIGTPELQTKRATINQIIQSIKIEQPQWIDPLKQSIN